MICLLEAVKRTTVIRRFLQQLGYSQNEPTVIAEDNQPLIHEVTHNRITSRVRHLDVPLAHLQEKYLHEIFIPVYKNTSLQPADVNTKPHGGTSLRKIILPIIGFSSYPPSDSEHFKLLQLDTYNISMTKISQRRKL